jgi:hypothetical protein
MADGSSLATSDQQVGEPREAPSADQLVVARSREDELILVIDPRAVAVRVLVPPTQQVELGSFRSIGVPEWYMLSPAKDVTLANWPELLAELRKLPGFTFATPVFQAPEFDGHTWPAPALHVRGDLVGIKAMGRNFPKPLDRWTANFHQIPGVHRGEWTGDDGLELLTYASVLSMLPDVEFAEPDMFMPVKRTGVSDPLYPQQWGLNNTGQSGGAAGIDIAASGGWRPVATDAQIGVAVFDDAISLDHPDIPVAATHDPVGVGPAPRGPCESHGTAVAGVIAARTNNSRDIAGAAGHPGMTRLLFVRCSRRSRRSRGARRRARPRR